MTSFNFLEDIVVATAEGVRPPERLSVSQAAAKYRYLNNPGAYVGPWLNETTPYLTEFMDVLSSEEFTGAIFAGPAQCGKTDAVLNLTTQTVVCDPVDLMIVEATRDRARDFSMRRIDRLHENTPEVKARVRSGRNNDNTFDKHYTSGMLLTLSWPTKGNLSGKPIPRIWLSDYDRMPMDVEGEGSPFDLAKKRTTTFRSFGMTVAESSPSFPIENPDWMKKTRHEAPPTAGILALYNRGDRRRWYWRCVSCKNSFEPDFSLMTWPDTEDKLEAAEAATMVCPHCAAKYAQQATSDMPGKHEMNRNHARWVRDGMIWTPEGDLAGTPVRSDIASFWLKGVCATFADYKTLVFNYLAAEEEYEQTGSEEALKTTVNTDQGTPYVYKAQASLRSPEELKSRAKSLGVRKVPPGVRFLVAAIDLQKNRFVVQVMGFGVAEGQTEPDCWIIDRFDIKKSRRVDDDGERFWVNLGANPEDWKQLTDEVLGKTYELADGSGRHMAIKLVVSDSAGREGFTKNAYNFVRWLRKGDPEGQEDNRYVWEPDLAPRFQLIRGDPNRKAPRVRLTYPDSERKDRHAGARGEIPVVAINVNVMKDSVDTALDRTEPGGRVNFPDWLDTNFYTELTVETKDNKGEWKNLKRHRNESWDLLTYAFAACLTQKINIENIEWSGEHCPSWAAEWDDNDLVFDPEMRDKPFERQEANSQSLAELAKSLG